MPEQKQRPRQPIERLLSAREAALWLQVNPRTAQLRARRALRADDPAVRTVAGAYVTPDWWWQKAPGQAHQSWPTAHVFQPFPIRAWQIAQHLLIDRKLAPARIEQLHQAPVSLAKGCPHCEHPHSHDVTASSMLEHVYKHPRE